MYAYVCTYFAPKLKVSPKITASCDRNFVERKRNVCKCFNLHFETLPLSTGHVCSCQAIVSKLCCYMSMQE